MDASVISSSVRPVNKESGVTSASALPIGETIKEYVITGIIGEGGFGIVYSARDTLLQRNVAIKEYMPASIANRLASAQINLRSQRHQQTFAAGMQGFIEEARLLAQFKHPSLVEILRFWEANGTAYMVMPHYSGKTLRSLLKMDRTICSEAWLKSILSPILDAIELLHSHQIYHRDIAPDNIVIQENGQPVLLDLGSARRVIAGMQSALTVVVKPGYAPIEQYTEDTANDQGPWTDIYALGAVLFFAITGAAPSASVSRMMRDTLKPLSKADHPHFSDNFLAAVNRALQLRPLDRFQSVSEFRDALQLNTQFSSAIALPASLTQPGTPEDNSDEEITQILSEDEINQFKQKLLQTLATSEATPKTQAQPLSNEAQAQPLNPSENLLVTPPVAPQPLSSFADVKDLLEQRPVLAPKATTPKPAPVAAAPSAARPSTTKSQWPQWMPIAVGGALVISALATGIYLIAADGQDELAASEPPSVQAPAVQTQPPAIESPVTTNNPAFPATMGTQDTYSQSLPETPVPATTQSLEVIPATAPEASALTPSANTEIVPAGTEIVPAGTEIVPPGTEIVPPGNGTAQTQGNSDNLTATTEATAERPDSPAEETADATAGTQPAKRVKPIEDSQQSAGKTNQFGIAKLALVPWGEIWVDGQRYGVSPPVRELSLMPGTYQIELRNPGLPTETRTVTFITGDNPAIHHNFNAPQQKAPQPKAGSQADAQPVKNKPQVDAAPAAANDETRNTGNNTNTRDNKNTAAPTAQSKPETKPSSTTAPAITTERTLNIKVTPWGEVVLDGKMAGVTPPLRQLKLSPGEHTIEIRHPSYATKTIRISASDPASATLEHNFQ